MQNVTTCLTPSLTLGTLSFKNYFLGVSLLLHGMGIILFMEEKADITILFYWANILLGIASFTLCKSTFLFMWVEGG